MTDPTQLFHTAIAADDALTEAHEQNASLGQRRALHQESKAKFTALTEALANAVPFELVKDGQVVATVRTMGAITDPGWMLNYSEKPDAEWCFKGQSLKAVDEVRAVLRQVQIGRAHV